MTLPFDSSVKSPPTALAPTLVATELAKVRAAGVLNCTVPSTALVALASVMAPVVAETTRPCDAMAPVWLTAPPAASVSLPPTVAPATTSAVESVKDASFGPVRATVSVPNALPALLSAIAPLVVETLRPAATIAPLWLMAPPAASVSVPPTVAPAMTPVDRSKSVASLLPSVATVSVAKALPLLVSTIAPLAAETFRPAARIAPVWLIAPPAVSVSVPPTLAPATVRTVESRECGVVGAVRRDRQAPKLLPALVSVMAPVAVETLKRAGVDRAGLADGAAGGEREAAPDIGAGEDDRRTSRRQLAALPPSVATVSVPKALPHCSA